ncbi:meiosis arrest female protein 1-like protein [Dinothrombium tinctorium]|uniref:Meiosis regulator and mRNA stability factor 1 n=1 Tax=Dinothrombium tinctorium TaxID=1965070 RepID=A0A3S3PNF1_9ACAR|nr:meiosis arrest female protein 1-like protein [Dinothrombium tinctorium]RWS16060.1 meiosis arrest female protein 1-like protein [Dinothrombium tinctorium]RWS16082.1 meiosis arrest female protein 1-like protein [Dinothrombium tinctorium]
MLGPEANTPFGIFWDIENCGVPRSKSANDIVLKIRKYIVKPYGYREYEFFCSCDTSKLSQQICEELNLAGVTVAHVPSTSKNAADEKIKEQMSKFVDTHGAKATVMLISGDVNFAPTLRGFRDRIGVKIIVMHNSAVSQELINCADRALFNFAEFCADIVSRPSTAPDTGEVHIRVDGLPQNTPRPVIRSQLQQLTYNRGGKTVDIQNESAWIAFPSQRDAERAIFCINGAIIGNSTLSASISNSVIPKKMNQKSNATQNNAFKQLSATSLPLSPRTVTSAEIKTSQGTAPLVSLSSMNTVTTAKSNMIPLIPISVDGSAISIDNTAKLSAFANDVSLPLAPSKSSKNIPPRFQKMNTTHLRVDGIPPTCPKRKLKRFLKELAKDCPIKITKFENGYALLECQNSPMTQIAISEIIGWHTLEDGQIITINSLPVGGGMLGNPKLASSVENLQRAHRVILSGIPGKCPEEEVKQAVLRQLVGIKPKSMVISDGMVDMEFKTHKIAESVMAKFNGFKINDNPVKVTRSFKPRNAPRTRSASMNRTMKAVHEVNRRFDSEAALTLTQKWANNGTLLSYPQKFAEESKSGRFLHVTKLPPNESNAVEKKLNVLAKANNGDLISIHNTEAWLEFPDHAAAEKARGIIGSQLSLPGGPIGTETLKKLPKNIFEERKARVLVEKNNQNSLNNLSEAEGDQSSFLYVTGLSPKYPVEEMHSALSNLFEPYDGEVVRISNGAAFVKFTSKNEAAAVFQLFERCNVSILDKLTLKATICNKPPKMGAESA